MRSGRGVFAIGTIVFSLLAAAVACMCSSAVVRTLAASPLLFLLPGYSIIRASKLRLSGIECGVLSVALSVAITVLGGLLLNEIGALSEFGWIGLLSFCAIAPSLASMTRSDRVEMWLCGFVTFHRPAYWGICAIALFIGLGAIEIARAGAEQQQEFRFTELWMVTGSGSNDNLVTLGIRNKEEITTSYDIVLLSDGASIGRRSGILLQPGETWTDVLPLNGGMRQAKRVEAHLFRSSQPDTIYRKTWISSDRRPINVSRDQ